MPSIVMQLQQQRRAELESHVLGNLLGLAGWEGEELAKRTVRDRYLVGVLAPRRSAGAETMTLLKQVSLLFDMGGYGT